MPGERKKCPVLLIGDVFHINIMKSYNYQLPIKACNKATVYFFSPGLLATLFGVRVGTGQVQQQSHVNIQARKEEVVCCCCCSKREKQEKGAEHYSKRYWCTI